MAEKTEGIVPVEQSNVDLVTEVTDLVTSKQAYEANALFSEIGVPWARRSEPFSTENYTQFPVRFRAKVEKEEMMNA